MLCKFPEEFYRPDCEPCFLSVCLVERSKRHAGSHFPGGSFKKSARRSSALCEGGELVFCFVFLSTKKVGANRKFPRSRLVILHFDRTCK